ncbi:MAG: septation protein IspZ [Maritimibacter sp.]|jgi:intracellular septation protein
MADKKNTATLNGILEYGPLIAFFVGYFLLKDQTFTVGGREYSGFIATTALFVPLLSLTTYLQYRLTGTLSKMQIVTLVLVVVMGGLTVVFNNESFFKMKPTIIYLLFAGLLGFGLMRGQSYMELVMSHVMPIERAGWMILTRRVMYFFLLLAVANEVIWRSFPTSTWVTFKVFGLTIGTFVFFMSQYGLLKKYALSEEEREN